MLELRGAIRGENPAGIRQVGEETQVREGEVMPWNPRAVEHEICFHCGLLVSDCIPILSGVFAGQHVGGVHCTGWTTTPNQLHNGSGGHRAQDGHVHEPRPGAG